MPTPSPALPTFTSDVMVTAVGLNAVGSNLTNLYSYTMGGFRTLKPICAVRATTQTIPAGSGQQLIWDTKDFDYDGMWNSGSTGLLTVQTAGVYRLHLNAGHNGPTGFTVAGYILINGTTISTNAVGSTNVGGSMVPASALMGLAAGATIYGFIVQNTSGSVSPATTSGGCRLTAEWVSP